MAMNSALMERGLLNRTQGTVEKLENNINNKIYNIIYIINICKTLTSVPSRRRGSNGRGGHGERQNTVKKGRLLSRS